MIKRIEAEGGRIMLKALSIAGVIVVCILCAGCDVSAPNSTTNTDQKATTSTTPASAPAEDSTPKWEVTSDTDRMTNATQWFATSPTVSSMDPMSAPYNDTQAWLGVGCDGKSEWAYVGFSDSPNLTNTNIHNGYSSIYTPIKWDSKIETVTLTQKWGAKFLGFDSNKEAIKNIVDHKSVLLELSWYSSGDVYFKFPLDGADKTVQTIRLKCALSTAASLLKHRKS